MYLVPDYLISTKDTEEEPPTKEEKENKRDRYVWETLITKGRT